VEIEARRVNPSSRKIIARPRIAASFLTSSPL
jgi:hypothetical protein